VALGARRGLKDVWPLYDFAHPSEAGDVRGQGRLRAEPVGCAMTSGIHHVAVRVHDLDRSIAFYERHFALHVASRATLTNGARIAFLADPGGGCELELIAGLDDHLPGDGLVHHVAFLVDDVAAAFAGFRAAGLPLLDEAPQSLASGRQLFSLRGPDGERLQVTSR
jgi:lactoylglutathione lyase